MLRRLPICGFVLLATLRVAAQDSIDPKQASHHIGQKVITCGTVSGGKYLPESKGQPTLLDIGAAYPNQWLTVLIWQENRGKFTYHPEEYLLNKQICVTGELKEYRGKPEIIVSDTSQLQLRPR
jgi:micrococcal nuclease